MDDKNIKMIKESLDKLEEDRYSILLIPTTSFAIMINRLIKEIDKISYNYYTILLFIYAGVIITTILLSTFFGLDSTPACIITVIIYIGVFGFLTYYFNKKRKENVSDLTLTNGLASNLICKFYNDRILTSYESIKNKLELAMIYSRQRKDFEFPYDTDVLVKHTRACNEIWALGILFEIPSAIKCLKNKTLAKLFKPELLEISSLASSSIFLIYCNYIDQNIRVFLEAFVDTRETTPTEYIIQTMNEKYDTYWGSNKSKAFNICNATCLTDDEKVRSNEMLKTTREKTRKVLDDFIDLLNNNVIINDFTVDSFLTNLENAVIPEEIMTHIAAIREVSKK